MKPLLEMTFEELRDAMADAGGKPYRAGQLADWVYTKGVTDPTAMTNLPTALAERFEILISRAVSRADSRDECVKLLIETHDSEHVETVLIPDQRRTTACLSTQVGCAMGCTFCASGADGLRRNLAAGEILEQILHLRQASGRTITHVVFMGIGEPLANYEATVAAVRAIVDPRRFGISARRVTISTVGLPGQIRRLAKENLPVTLAISLHAADDILRRELIPTARRYPIREILSAAEEYYEARKREITLEYVLLSDVNDSPLCAEALARIARRLRCNVNLIRYNPAAALPYRPPAQAGVEAFAERLRRRGVNVQIRRSRGADAEAACGQLRRRRAAQSPR